MKPCKWCQQPFPAAVIGGREQEFCKPHCRATYHTALRRYAAGLVRAGFLTTRDLREWHDAHVHGGETA